MQESIKPAQGAVHEYMRLFTKWSERQTRQSQAVLFSTWVV